MKTLRAPSIRNYFVDEAGDSTLFDRKGNIVSTAPIHVIPSTPPESPGLQVADYFLWALQRLYERREDRYVEYLWGAFRMVHDIDDTRAAKYGVY